MKKSSYLYLAIAGMIFLNSSTSTLYAQGLFKGYLEHRTYITSPDNKFSPGDLKDNLSIGSYNRARMIYENNVSESSSLTVAVDYFNQSGFLLDLYKSADDLSANNSSDRISIDRAYLKFSLKNTDFTFGKQLLSWGRSFIFSPFDIFNRVNAFDPNEEKGGINAYKFSMPLGDLGALEGVYEITGRYAESRKGIRALWNYKQVDYGINTMYNTTPEFKQYINGIEVKADLGIGLWLEAAHIEERPFEEGGYIGSGSWISENKYLYFTTGADYSFDVGKMLFVMTEYVHDEGGADNKANYDFSRITSGRSQYLAKDYLYSSAMLQYSEYLSLTAAVFSNLNDSGSYILPSLQYLIFNNTEFNIGGFIPVASKGTEFNPADVFDPQSRAGNITLYMWIKLFF